MIEHHEKSPFPFSLVLLIAVIILGGIFHFYSPTKTMRLSFSEKEIEEYKGEEKILSRLWQDPFQAVEKYIKDSKTKQGHFCIPNILNEWENSAIFQNHSNNNLSTLQEDLPIYEDNNTNNNHLLLLPVIINTGTYIEDFEERLRTRYAVLSAFHFADYIPEDADHIGVFKYTIQGDETNIPFEWLKKNTPTLREKSPPYDMALIIWVGDKYFGIQPDTIEDLIDRVKDLLKPNYCTCSIIDSTTLSFVQYLKQSQKTQSQEKNNKNNLYYTRAYVNPHILINKTPGVLSIPDIIKKLSESPKSPTFFLSKTPFHYIHTELDTIQLTDALVNELDKRNIDLKSAGSDHIVLISDWDTYYRRDLPLSFAISVQKYRDEKKEDRTHTKKQNEEQGWPDRIHCLEYMRGIDGFVPGVDPEKYREKYSAENSPENIAKDFDYFNPKFEQPIGPDQYDYIRRITDQLKDMPCKKKDIRAIGILGKDVYDKLLILRALREEFPNVIFFTTDIDARYWHHTELQYTRGLVVASSYGLQLCHKYQGDILPFRSSYQTSLFTATLLALDSIDKDDKDELKNNTPRICEIGWRGPYDLTPHNPHNIHPVDPERHYLNLKWNTQTSYFLFLVFLSWVVLWLLTHYTSPQKVYFKDRSSYQRFKLSWKIFRYVSGAFFAIFFIVALISSSSVTGEPITLLDGISIWPTNLMRLFCGSLSVYLLILSIQHIKRFHYDCINCYHCAPIGKNPEHNICNEWHKFMEGKNKKRNWLIGIGCILHTFSSFVYMFFINSPLISTRGNLCFLTDKVILCGGFFIMSLLTCYIVIDTYYFWRFMQDELLEQICLSQSQGIAQQTTNNNKSEEKDIIKLMHIFIFIAKKTEVSGKITTYPFIALFLVILSRNSFFENLTWTLPISIVIGLTVIIILFSAILLFHTAKDLRHRIIHRLKDELLEFKKPLGYNAQKFRKGKGKTKSEKDETKRKEAAFLESCIQYIENLKIGAFAPLSHNSIFIALLTPFGGIGTASLIQYLFHQFS